VPPRGKGKVKGVGGGWACARPVGVGWRGLRLCATRAIAAYKPPPSSGMWAQAGGSNRLKWRLFGFARTEALRLPLLGRLGHTKPAGRTAEGVGGGCPSSPSPPPRGGVRAPLVICLNKVVLQPIAYRILKSYTPEM
jgi:hypothetical protein